MSNLSATLQALKARIEELVNEKPEKAAIILTEWLKQTPKTKKSSEKAA